MENSLLKVPLEMVNKYFRLRQKLVEKVFDHLIEQIESNPTTIDTNEMLLRFEGLRRQVEEWTKQEQQALGYLGTRIQYLKQYASSYPSNDEESGSHLPPFIDYDTLIADYCYRYGYSTAGDCIYQHIEASAAPDRTQLIDREPLTEIYTAASALRNDHSLQPAFTFVHNYGSRLRRIESTIEFALHRQQFIEYLRMNKKQEAIQYASTYLAPAVPSDESLAHGSSSTSRSGDGSSSSSSSINTTTTSDSTIATGTNEASSTASYALRTTMMHQLQTVMSALAFPDPEHCNVPEIEKLFHDNEWITVADKFTKEAYRVIGVPIESSLLETFLSIGLTFLKCDTCMKPLETVRNKFLTYPPSTSNGSSSSTSSASSSLAPLVQIPVSDNADNMCPVCTIPEYFVPAASYVPSLQHSVTRILDPLTNDVMDEHNPSYVILTNGRVYSKKTLAALLTPDGKHVLCPHTGEIFAVNDNTIKRVYFV